MTSTTVHTPYCTSYGSSDSLPDQWWDCTSTHSWVHPFHSRVDDFPDGWRTVALVGWYVSMHAKSPITSAHRWLYQWLTRHIAHRMASRIGRRIADYIRFTTPLLLVRTPYCMMDGASDHTPHCSVYPLVDTFAAGLYAVLHDGLRVGSVARSLITCSSTAFCTGCTLYCSLEDLAPDRSLLPLSAGYAEGLCGECRPLRDGGTTTLPIPEYVCDVDQKATC